LRKKLLFGVGINDADYVVKVQKELQSVNGKRVREAVFECQYYRTWKHILEHGYSESFKKRTPSYKDCTVQEEWFRFTTFKNWMQSQIWEFNGELLQLDKDILIEGNLQYGEDTCVFVPSRINKLFTTSFCSKGVFYLGVTKYSNRDWLRKQYIAKSKVNGKINSLGDYLTEYEAHCAWRDFKIKELTEIRKDYMSKPYCNVRVAERLDGKVIKLVADKEMGVPTTCY